MINVVLIAGVGNRPLEAVGRYFRAQRYGAVYQLVVEATHVGVAEDRAIAVFTFPIRVRTPSFKTVPISL